MTLLDIDFRFIDSEYPFLVLVNLVELVDQNMPSIIQEEVKRIEEKYKDGGENWLEKESDIQALDQFVYEDFPRFFFGSMLIALWSSFEAALYELVKYMKGQNPRSEDFMTVRGKTVLHRAKKYLRRNLRYSFTTPDWEYLQMLRILRNAIVHTNGRLELVDKKNKKRIERYINQGIGISASWGVIIISKDFLVESYMRINATVRQIVSTARKKYPRVKEEGRSNT